MKCWMVGGSKRTWKVVVEADVRNLKIEEKTKMLCFAADGEG